MNLSDLINEVKYKKEIARLLDTINEAEDTTFDGPIVHKFQAAMLSKIMQKSPKMPFGDVAKYFNDFIKTTLKKNEGNQKVKNFIELLGKIKAGTSENGGIVITSDTGNQADIRKFESIVEKFASIAAEMKKAEDEIMGAL